MLNLFLMKLESLKPSLFWLLLSLNSHACRIIPHKNEKRLRKRFSRLLVGGSALQWHYTILWVTPNNTMLSNLTHLPHTSLIHKPPILSGNQLFEYPTAVKNCIERPWPPAIRKGFRPLDPVVTMFVFVCLWYSQAVLYEIKSTG